MFEGKVWPSCTSNSDTNGREVRNSLISFTRASSAWNFLNWAIAWSLPGRSCSICCCAAAICPRRSRNPYSRYASQSSNTAATTMAAPLMKKAVRTTFVSGNRSKLRKFGCHGGTAGAALASDFFFSSDSIGNRNGWRNHQAEEPEPPRIQATGHDAVGDHDFAGLQPGAEIERHARDSERRGDSPIEPGQLWRRGGAEHLAHRLARLHLIEADRGLQLLEELLDQQRAHAGEVEGVGEK